MKAYISVSFSKRAALNDAVKTITEALRSSAITPFIFVDVYHFHPVQEKEMMTAALKEIDNCDLLIAETSDKAIGIGIEAGYAKAKNKPVIYLRSKDAQHSTTLSGISDHTIVYADIPDLKNQLKKVLERYVQA